MQNMYIKPMLWYIAKLKYIDEELAKLPNVVVSTHGKYNVIICKDSYGRHEYREKSSIGNKYFKSAKYRSYLINERAKLINELYQYYRAKYDTVKDNYIVDRSGNTSCSSSFFEKLEDDANAYKNEYEYKTNGYNFRSRFEMEGAQVLSELDIPYKYEASLYLGEKRINPDFALNFPEFNSCVFWELLGKLNEPGYAYSQGQKLGDYSTAGLIVGRDIFLTGGTKTYMPNANLIKNDVIHIIRTLCERCVHKIARK